jgi:hypothetical protein
MGVVIVSGFKRTASETADAGAPSGADVSIGVGAAHPDARRGTVQRLAEVTLAVARATRGCFTWLTDRAAGRALAPSSLIGISLLLALSAAAWFSGGTAADELRGTIALAGWLLARSVAVCLAAIPPERSDRPAGGVVRIRVRAGPGQDTSTDWLILPGLIWPDDAQGGQRPGTRPGTLSGPWSGTDARADDDDDAKPRQVAWLSTVCTTAAECAIYGGIAAGGQQAGWTGMWALAVVTIVSVAVADTIGSCSGAAASRPAPGGAASAGTGNSALRQAGGWLIRAAVAPPASVRVLLAALGLAIAGPRVALFTVLAVEVASVCCTGLRPRLSAAPVSHDAILAGRDDGAVARWAGRLVRGNLIPLPPAVAGVCACVLLAILGMRNLPGMISLTPLVVMMLASPGSSHPHDGKRDWLVPAVLCLGQDIYLGALGFAWSVPGPVVFSVCAMNAVWYANLAAGVTLVKATGQRTRPGGQPGAGIGWEGRMFVAGLAAIFGIATFGYVGLAAYLGALIGRKAMIGYHVPREESPR